MTPIQREFLKFIAWEAMAVILGWIAIHDHAIFPAFLSGALTMAALGDCSDNLKALSVHKEQGT